MLPQKIVMTLKMFLHLNIMTSAKSITLKYPSNRYPYSIYMRFLSSFDDPQHLSCTKKVFEIPAISETRITRQVSVLTLPVLCISESCVEIKIKLNLLFSHFFVLQFSHKNKLKSVTFN